MTTNWLDNLISESSVRVIRANGAQRSVNRWLCLDCGVKFNGNNQCPVCYRTENVIRRNAEEE